MPLTELVHFFNKRNQLIHGRDEHDSIALVDGRVQARFGAMLFATRFQSVVEAASGRVVGHEAFLHVAEGAGRGLPAAAVFLDTADDAELVYLDRLARTLHALNFLLERGQQDGFLALNVHPQLLRAVRAHHGHVFESILARCGLTPERVILELADDGFEDVGRLAEVMAGYRARGYRIAIDNFGRHGSDLERLETLAPDLVKLDRSLVGHAGHLSLAGRVLPELTRELHRMGLTVVCQCIETPWQLELARQAGADWLQGRLIAPPGDHCQSLARPRQLSVVA